MLEHFKSLSFHEDVANDLKKLDGSQLMLVLKALQRIEESNGEIGENLGKRNDTNLKGYKKVKLRKHGIRIVFKQMNNEIVVAKIICIGKREDDEVYKEAYKRLLSQKGKNKKE